MYRKIKIYFYVAVQVNLLFVIFSTCKKSCLECNTCEDFPDPKGSVISTITQMPNQRHAPCFNPNNNNEFIYLKDENNSESLVKYNMATKIEQTLINNIKILGQPKWNKNGWIVFTKTDLKMYLIKDNGDSAHTIPIYYSENSYPSFIGNDKIFYSVGTETKPGISGNKIINYKGSMIDSIKAADLNASFGINDVNGNNEIVSWICDNTGCSIKYFTYEKKDYKPIYSFSFTGRNNITGIIWHPNNDDVYFSTYREGLYRVNKNTKKYVKVRNGCDSRSYRYLSISPDGSKIIIERVDATDYTKNLGSWTEEGKIFIMDIDGKNERNVFE